MAEPLKNLLHPGLVKDMAGHIVRATPDFDAARFTRLATQGMEALELMQRAEQIRDALTQTLPADYAAAAGILRAALPREGGPGLAGWALLPVNQFAPHRDPRQRRGLRGCGLRSSHGLMPILSHLRKLGLDFSTQNNDMSPSVALRPPRERAKDVPIPGC